MIQLPPGRKNERETIVFQLTSNGQGANLSSATKVTLYKRLAGEPWSTLRAVNTTDNPTVLAITTASTGVVTLTTDATFWDQPGTWYLYFVVTMTPPLNFPRSEDMTIDIIDGV